MAQTGHLVLIDSDNDNVISELSRIAEDINPVWTPALTVKKYRSLQNQLLVLETAGTEESFDRLKKFFFEQKKFGMLASKPKLEKYLLPYILLSRSGPSELLVLLFLSLGKTLHLQIEVIQHNGKLILKVIDQGKSRLFDFKQKGKELSTEQIIELINSGCDCTQTAKWTDLLSQYLILLKTQCLRERSLLHFYKVQTYLVHHQPFALNHLVDRARAAYAVGDLVKAAEDLSRYVAFHSDKMTNNRYAKLIKKIKDEKILKNIPYFNDTP